MVGGRMSSLVIFFKAILAVIALLILVLGSLGSIFSVLLFKNIIIGIVVVISFLVAIIGLDCDKKYGLLTIASSSLAAFIFSFNPGTDDSLGGLDKVFTFSTLSALFGLIMTIFLILFLKSINIKKSVK
jgi:hypothetical protein